MPERNQFLVLKRDCQEDNIGALRYKSAFKPVQLTQISIHCLHVLTTQLLVPQPRPTASTETKKARTFTAPMTKSVRAVTTQAIPKSVDSDSSGKHKGAIA